MHRRRALRETSGRSGKDPETFRDGEDHLSVGEVFDRAGMNPLEASDRSRFSCFTNTPHSDVLNRLKIVRSSVINPSGISAPNRSMVASSLTV